MGPSAETVLDRAGLGTRDHDHATHHADPERPSRPVLHTWLRAGEDELIAHLHVPSTGTARGAVVLADGLSREQITGFRTYHLLADELSSRGFLAIRFAWTGTSDSSEVRDDDDRDAVQRMLDDLHHVVGHARSMAPGAAVTLFGLRAAATVCAEYSRRNPGTVRQLLMWEPTGSVRSWLRGQETLHKMSSEFHEREIVPDLPEGSVEVPGHLFAPRDVAALRALTMTDVGGARVDAVVRPDLVMDRAVKAVLADGHVTVLDGQAQALDVSTMIAVVSRETVAALADAAEQVAGAPVPLVVPTPRHEAAVAHRPVRGRPEPVVERIVSANGLYAILTSPPAVLGAPSRAVLSIPGSSDPMAGPTWLWTQVNRDLAARGAASVRFDRCRVGEHIEAADLSDPWPYRGSAVDDAVEAYDWLEARTGLTPMMYGMCSGSWIALHVAARRPASVVIAINPVAWDIEARPEGNPPPMALPIEGDGPLPAVAPGAESTTARLRRLVKGVTPYPVWRWLAARGHVQMAEPLYEMATRGGTTLHQVMCSKDLAYAQGQQLDKAVRSLVAEGRDITTLRRLRADHSLLSHSSRRQIRDDVLALVNRAPAHDPHR